MKLQVLTITKIHLGEEFGQKKITNKSHAERYPSMYFC